jgi:hypothetical protein
LWPYLPSAYAIVASLVIARPSFGAHRAARVELNSRLDLDCNA